MKYDVIIAGGGVAGLTAAAYCEREGLSTALFEKQETLGGLVQSVERDGFIFDMGLRAIEDSGIVLPMLSELGIHMEYEKSTVSIGIEDRIISVQSEQSLEEYRNLLESFYPEHAGDIRRIMKVIRRIMKDMDVLYGIENPLFKDLAHDYRYIVRTLIPWIGKFLFTIGKINRMQEPVEQLLDKLTDSSSLKCIIGQHFFRKTPAFFAMSYFSVYLDYMYPKGGTGSLTKLLSEHIVSRGVTVKTGQSIISIDPEHRTVANAAGERFGYKKLIWCCDQNLLYKALDTASLSHKASRIAVHQRKNVLEKNRGGDSVFSLFLSVDKPPQYFSDISDGHFFYTPSSRGLGDLHTVQLQDLLGCSDARPRIEAYLKAYLAYTTYEISIPVLKDPAMAPEGKTGVIISCLMEYELCRKAVDDNWYEEYKQMCCDEMIAVLSRSLYPGLKEKIMNYFCSTPRSIELLTGNTQGAITGWSFDTHQIPAVHEMQKVAQSVLTPMDHILQAGQWCYSPSGLPISVLTGKLAALRAAKGSMRT